MRRTLLYQFAHALLNLRTTCSGGSFHVRQQMFVQSLSNTSDACFPMNPRLSLLLRLLRLRLVLLQLLLPLLLLLLLLRRNERRRWWNGWHRRSAHRWGR